MDDNPPSDIIDDEHAQLDSKLQSYIMAQMPPLVVRAVVARFFHCHSKGPRTSPGGTQHSIQMYSKTNIRRALIRIVHTNLGKKLISH